MAKLWTALRFDRAAMRRAAGGFALATDLAEYLVARGVPFRAAHEIVGALVRETADAGRTLEELSLPDLKRHSHVFERDALTMLDADRSVARRTVTGGPAPRTTQKRIKELDR
jgi:argininosuccinate lyase